ncbi:MAG: zinc-binding dehydrogenase, partial [Gammaproteobacteria bacterium]
GYCMGCQYCLSGDHNLCMTAQPTIVAHYGGFAEQVRARAASVIPLPSGLDAKTAGPLFCGGITVFNPLVQFDVKPTARVGVIGIGGLGHMALAFLNAWGCEVTAFSSTPEKRTEVLELGAHHTLDSRDPAALKQMTGYFDLILSTVNVPLDWSAYMGTLKKKGRLHFVGVTLDPVELQIKSMISAQHSVSGSPVGAPATIARMLDFAVQHGIAPITEHFGFDAVNDALHRLRSGETRYRVVLSR